MHAHLEIIMPPTDKVEENVSTIMSRFDHNCEDDADDNYDSKYSFHDSWCIGGRWSGNKLISSLDEGKIQLFELWLRSENITISSIQTGKPSNWPSNLISKIDAKWNELFPNSKIKQCPLFNHVGDNLYGDILKLSECEVEKIYCHHVIITNKNFEPAEMLVNELYNGVSWQKSDWDKSLKSALEKVENFKDLSGDWLVVTIDYHS